MGTPHSKDLHQSQSRSKRSQSQSRSKRSQSQRAPFRPDRVERTQSLIETPAAWEPAPAPPILFRSEPDLNLEATWNPGVAWDPEATWNPGAAWETSSMKLAPPPGTILEVQILGVQTANLIFISYMRESTTFKLLIELNGIIVPEFEIGKSKLERALGSAIRDYIADLLARADPISCRFERAGEHHVRGDFLLGRHQESLVQHLLARGMVKYDEGTPASAWTLDEMRAILRLSMNG